MKEKTLNTSRTTNRVRAFTSIHSECSTCGDIVGRSVMQPDCSATAAAEAEEVAWEWFASAHPHEAHAKWPDRFWTLFQSRCPGVTREQMERTLMETGESPNCADEPSAERKAVNEPTTQTALGSSAMVRRPEFDSDGYPTEETERAIKGWDFRDVPGWLAYIREAWNHHYGRMWEESGMLKLATGGWSGNEAITHAMRENYVLWAMLWESSHREGIEVLRMPNSELRHADK